jgi:hypothetical protein
VAEGTLVVAIVNALLVTVAVALARTVGSATLMALTVMEFTLLATGALNNPLAEMLPALADQVTAVLLVLLTSAENCTAPFAATGVAVGEICTLTELVGGTIVIEYPCEPDEPVGLAVTVIPNGKAPA